MDAADRAKLLKNLKVQFGDLEASADIGNLAIGSVNTFGARRIAVHKGRLYHQSPLSSIEYNCYNPVVVKL